MTGVEVGQGIGSFSEMLGQMTVVEESQDQVQEQVQIDTGLDVLDA